MSPINAGKTRRGHKKAVLLIKLADQSGDGDVFRICNFSEKDQYIDGETINLLKTVSKIRTRNQSQSESCCDETRSKSSIKSGQTKGKTCLRPLGKFELWGWGKPQASKLTFVFRGVQKRLIRQWERKISAKVPPPIRNQWFENNTNFEGGEEGGLEEFLEYSWFWGSRRVEMGLIKCIVNLRKIKF